MAQTKDRMIDVRARGRARALLCVAAALALMAALAAGLVGCGGSQTYNDGTYTGQSQNQGKPGDTGAGYGVVELTVSDGKISACTFTTYELDGTVKDESYGAGNEVMYEMAQTAVASCDEYASQLVAKGDIKGVDTITGATINYNEFKEAVADALSQAGA